jgi:hypothetical protein
MFTVKKFNTRFRENKRGVKGNNVLLPMRIRKNLLLWGKRAKYTVLFLLSLVMSYISTPYKQ